MPWEYAKQRFEANPENKALHMLSVLGRKDRRIPLAESRALAELLKDPTPRVHPDYRAQCFLILTRVREVMTTRGGESRRRAATWKLKFAAEALRIGSRPEAVVALCDDTFKARLTLRLLPAEQAHRQGLAYLLKLQEQGVPSNPLGGRTQSIATERLGFSLGALRMRIARQLMQRDAHAPEAEGLLKQALKTLGPLKQGCVPALETTRTTSRGLLARWYRMGGQVQRAWPLLKDHLQERAELDIVFAVEALLGLIRQGSKAEARALLRSLEDRKHPEFNPIRRALKE